MNKFKKIIVAILGATNTVFSIFIPIAIALLLLPYTRGWYGTALLIIGILSSFYRAIDIGFLRE